MNYLFKPWHLWATLLIDVSFSSGENSKIMITSIFTHLLLGASILRKITNIHEKSDV